nr:ankyrin repeat domain-containing protein [Pseudochelatococcus lubricantis]
MRAVYDADNRKAVAALKQGVDVNAMDPVMGLTALHIAVGTNNLALTRILVEEWGAEIKPDGRGRWPTLIAARCRVDTDLCDYIVQIEAKAYYGNCRPA